VLIVIIAFYFVYFCLLLSFGKYPSTRNYTRNVI